jgi:Zn-dependent peptidase ImmA (M78 family)
VEAGGGTHRQTNLTGQILGLSNLDSHMTYIRGYAVLHPFGERVEFSPRHTIAHELGHILLHTADEDKAEKKAGELLSGRMVAKAPQNRS